MDKSPFPSWIKAIKSLLVATVFALSSILLEAQGIETALWDGSCQNITYGGKGLVKLLLLPSGKTGMISGYLSITGFLRGSGDIVGKLGDHGKIEFKSVDPVAGTIISWQGFVKDGKITGEYFIEADPALRLAKQVGEWQVAASAQKLTGGESRPQQDVEAKFKRHFVFDLELRMNAMEKDASGRLTSRAQVYFDLIHPVGTATSICVDDADIEWIPGTTEAAEKNIRKITFDAILFWQGMVQKEGYTVIRVTYNYALQEVTDFTVLSSTGMTKEDTKKAAVTLGKVVGALALKALVAQ